MRAPLVFVVVVAALLSASVYPAEAVWTIEAPTAPPNALFMDTLFGIAVGLSEDGVLAVGEPNRGPDDGGVVWIYQCSNETGCEQAQQINVPGGQDSFFGRSLAMSRDGRVLVIGAPQSTPPTAYVAVRNDDGAGGTLCGGGDLFCPPTSITPTPALGAGSTFGGHVSVSGDGAYVFVGGTDPVAVDPAMGVHIYNRDAATALTWSHVQTVTTGEPLSLGSPVQAFDVSDDATLLGVRFRATGGLTGQGNAGAIWGLALYHRETATFVRVPESSAVATLHPEDFPILDPTHSEFASSVSLDDTYSIIAAPLSNRVVVVEHDGNGNEALLVNTTVLYSPAAVPGDYNMFGFALSLAVGLESTGGSDVLVVSAPIDVGVNGGKGTIFVYQKNPFSQEWSLSFQGSSNFTFDRVVNDLPSSTFGSVAIRQNDYFGKSVAVAGDLVVAGAPLTRTMSVYPLADVTRVFSDGPLEEDAVEVKKSIAGAVIGIVFGIIGLIILVVLALWLTKWCIQRRIRKKVAKKSTPEAATAAPLVDEAE